MQVKQIMSQPVATCCLDDSVNQAAKLMWEHDCGAVLVVDEAGRAAAMLTDRDICMAAYMQGKPLCDISVRSAMSKSLYACGPEDPLTQAEQIMQKRQVHRIPVLDVAGRPVGIVSLNDLARVATKQHQAAHGRLDGISAGSMAQTLAAICSPRTHEAAPGVT